MAGGTAAVRVYFLEISVILMFFFCQRFGGAGVGARPQNFGRACRRPQNGPSDALTATILGAPVEML
jgi:hypothetical protein